MKDIDLPSVVRNIDLPSVVALLFLGLLVLLIYRIIAAFNRRGRS